MSYAYIDNNLAQELSIDTLAAVADMGAHYLAAVFKQSTGLTLHQYVTQCRIAKAKELLIERDMPISEICQEVGFQNQSHFTRTFHKYVKTTPKVYRDTRQTA